MASSTQVAAGADLDEPGALIDTRMTSGNPNNAASPNADTNVVSEPRLSPTSAGSSVALMLPMIRENSADRRTALLRGSTTEATIAVRTTLRM